MSKVKTFIHCQVVTIASVPSFKKMNSPTRLRKKALLTEVLTWASAQFWLSGEGRRVSARGAVRTASVRVRLEERVSVVKSIAFTWSCTKSFWFLRPTDDYYPLKA